MSRTVRIAMLIAVALTLLLAALLLPAQPQAISYHGFADSRQILGIPNFWDVVSNLPFLAVGIAGLLFVLLDSRRETAFEDRQERWPYIVLFAGVALTCIGSAYYHLAPDNARLTWDRLPMTIAFMSLVAAMLAERIDAKAGMRLLFPLVALGAGSVAWWRLSAAFGAENLLPYIAVQFGSIAIVLLIAVLFPSRYARANDIYLVIALYAAAKVAETMDGFIFAAGSPLSGHTLKHLLAAAAAFAILRMLKSRVAEDTVAEGFPIDRRFNTAD